MLAAGLAVGLVGATAAVHILEHQLFAVEPFDAATLAATSVLMTAAGVCAIWLPARRASLANPVVSLKKGNYRILVVFGESQLAGFPNAGLPAIAGRGGSLACSRRSLTTV